MAGTRDFLLSNLTDSLLPVLRRSLEDVVYDILDRRGIPSRTDFKEAQETISRLRHEVSVLEARLKALEDQAARKPQRTKK